MRKELKKNKNKLDTYVAFGLAKTALMQQSKTMTTESTGNLYLVSCYLGHTDGRKLQSNGCNKRFIMSENTRDGIRFDDGAYEIFD